ncbi:MAG: VOC family protein [Dehalococcoidia bacterium]|nr:VOC family protein [Dehalococcoidia bacterium]
MKTGLYHLQVNIAPENVAFYRELMAFLGWDTLYETDGMLGVGGSNGASLWFIGASNGAANDYDGPGMNHLGIGAESIADVDAVVAHLREQGIAALFETPRHRPEFASDESSTYYQVMFKSPDNLLFEVVYTGPK